MFDLRVAAGAFGNEQRPEELARVLAPDHLRVSQDLFVACVHGESMNRLIPNGAWCLFRFGPKGTLDGRILVVTHHARADVAGGGGQYTVKRYRRAKGSEPDAGAVAVTLWPESHDASFQPIELDAADADELAVVAEFVQVLV